MWCNLAATAFSSGVTTSSYMCSTESCNMSPIQLFSVPIQEHAALFLADTQDHLLLPGDAREDIQWWLTARVLNGLSSMSCKCQSLTVDTMLTLNRHNHGQTSSQLLTGALSIQ